MTRAVFDAIAAGDAAMFAAALGTLDDLEVRGPGGSTPLHAAIFAGEVGFARQLLDRGADPNAAVDNSMVVSHAWSALQIAVSRGLPRMVELLLDRGAVLREKDDPIAWLSKAAPMPSDVAEALLGRAQGDVERDPRLWILRDLEARFGALPRPASLDAITAGGAKGRGDAGKRGDALGIEAALRDGDDAALEARLTAAFPSGPLPKRPRKEERSERRDALSIAVHLAAARGSGRAMRQLLDYGADPNDGDETPLHAAILAANLPVIDALLASGADPNRWIKDWSYPAGPPCASPISRAAEAGRADVLTRLLQKATKISEPKSDCEDFGAVAVAASPAIAAQLLSAGAKPTRAALHHALRSSWWEITGALLDRGAPLDAGRPAEPMAALDVALIAGAPLALVERIVAGGGRPVRPFEPTALPAPIRALLAQAGVEPPRPATLADALRFGDAADIIALAEREKQRGSAGLDWVIERLCHSARWDVLVALSRLLRPAYPQTVRVFCEHAPPAVAEACFEAWRIDVKAPKREDYIAHAAQGKNRALVLHLLQHGAKLLETEPDFITSDYLAMFGDPECMTIALDRGARASYQTAARWLKGARERGVVADERHPITARLLGRAGEHGAPELFVFVRAAAAFGDPVDLERALALGWDMLSPDPDMRAELATALVSACAQGRLENVAFFLDRGASPDPGPAAARRRPLVVAAAEGHLEVVQLLLTRGADPRATGEGGVTALGSARTPAMRALLADAGCESLHREVE